MMGPKRPGGPHPIMGRPPKEIDFKILDQLCMIQCTEAEIAAVFECNIDTLEARIHEKFGVTFSEYFEEKKGLGRISLRRRQYKRMMDGSDALLIFMGKNYLGQADKSEVKGTLSHTMYDGYTVNELEGEAEKLAGILEADKKQK